MDYKRGEPTTWYETEQAFAHHKFNYKIPRGHDLGLLHFPGDGIQGVTPSPLYRGAVFDLIGQEATTVGFGQTGTGDHRHFFTDFQKRAGTNVLDAFMAEINIAREEAPREVPRSFQRYPVPQQLISDFDSPTDPSLSSLGNEVTLERRERSSALAVARRMEFW